MSVSKPKDKEMVVAVAAQNGASSSGIPIEQPRQPGSLQGLLRFAMEATRAEDAPESPSNFQPLDAERREFLESTLNGMIGNPVEELEKSIKILEAIEAVDQNTDVEEVDKYLNTFEHITDFVGQVDLANAFHKIGGLSVFGPALHGNNTDIKMAACDLLAELCQNNPYWQDVIVHTEIISILLSILQKDEHAGLSNKTLYALSCITREHMDCYKRFVTYGGLNVLKDVLMREADQQRARSARLLTSLCRLDGDLPQRLCSLEYVNTLLETLDHQPTARTPQPPRTSNEQIVELLTHIVTEYPQGMDECLQEQQNVVRQLHPRDILQRHLDRLVEQLDALWAIEEDLTGLAPAPRVDRISNGEGEDNATQGQVLDNLMDRDRNNEEYINCCRLIHLIENIREVVDT